MTHEEDDVIETSKELASVNKELKRSKHTCLVMRTEHPRAYETTVVAGSP